MENDMSEQYLWPEHKQEELGYYAGGGLWSPDGKKLLVWYGYEWNTEFFLLNLDNGKTEPLATKMEDYFLTYATGWADEQRLVFTTRANRMKDGTQDYTFGYRSNLAVYDISTGIYELITDTGDGEFIEGISAGENGILFLHWLEERDDVTYGLMDLSGHVKWEKDLGQVLSAVLSPDGTSLAYVREKEIQQINKVYTLVIEKEGKRKEAAELLIGDHLNGPFWSPRGDRLLVSFSSAVPVSENIDAYMQRYHTLVIQP